MLQTSEKKKKMTKSDKLVEKSHKFVTKNATK